MRIKNTHTHYGLVSIILHWASAVLIAILFPLGLVMVNLGYYDPGYHNYPPIHKSLGIILFIIILMRIIWLRISPPPAPLPQAKILEILSVGVHKLLYLLIALVVISGYLISTADGRSIEVFNWFSIPALIKPFPNQADIAGNAHFYLAWLLVGIIALHALAAIKHQIIDKDRTLKRIFGG